MERDRRILGLALDALYAERQKIDKEIMDLERRLGRVGTKLRQVSVSRAPSSRLSPEGRKAISKAMKKRWAFQRARSSKVKRER